MHKPPQVFPHSFAFLRYVKHDHPISSVPSPLHVCIRKGTCFCEREGAPACVRYLDIFLTPLFDESYVSFYGESADSGARLERKLVPLFPHDVGKGLKCIWRDRCNRKDTGEADNRENGLPDILLPSAFFRRFFHFAHIPNHKLSLQNGNMGLGDNVQVISNARGIKINESMSIAYTP